MKKYFILLLFIPFINLYSNNTDSINRIINALIYIESKGDDYAVSKNGVHVGCLQISQQLVDDCNRILGYNKFKYSDRFNRNKSIEMFHVIQKYYNPSYNIENIIIIWNAGPYRNNHEKQRKKNKIEEYYNKVITYYYSIP